jgi:hypothetical protein
MTTGSLTVPPRGPFRLLLLVLTPILAWALAGCCNCPPPRTDLVPPPVVHRIFIRADCKINDADMNRKVSVPRGEWALWVNQTSSLVTLTFGSDSPFGVPSTLVPPNGTRKLEVVPDASTGEHEYEAGPIIIVPPPGG